MNVRYTHYHRMHIPTKTIDKCLLPMYEGQEYLTAQAALSLINEWNRMATLSPEVTYHYWL